MSRKRSIIIGVLLLVAATSIMSFFISSAFFIGWNYFNPKYDISFEPGAVSIDNIKKFNQVRNIIKNNYYEDVDENVMLEGAISGMADSLGDPYTVYYTKEQMEKILEIPKKSEETYVGIGISITTDNNGLVTVLEPFEDSPAFNAGIRMDDKIIKVNGEDVTALKDEGAVVKMIKGPENTLVEVTVFRPSEGRTIDFKLVRKKITIALNIKSAILEDNIGYIRILSFMDENIDKIFEEHLNKLLEKGIQGLIIDLRDNPGGYLYKVINIADRLLPEGLIVYTKDRYNTVNKEESDKQALNLPLAVIINGNSASASEILAGAIKDHQKGTLVGTTTFGKGIVQQLMELDDGSGVKVTTSRYFTPNGISIHGVGIKPDIEIEQTEKYRNEPVSFIPKEDDAQLQSALEVIRKSIK